MCHPAIWWFRFAVRGRTQSATMPAGQNRTGKSRARGLTNRGTPMDDLTDQNMQFPSNWQELATPQNASVVLNRPAARQAPSTQAHGQGRPPLTQVAGSTSQNTRDERLRVSDPLEFFHRPAANTGPKPAQADSARECENRVLALLVLLAVLLCVGFSVWMVLAHGS
jgi:hypothetical protein